MVEEEKDKNFGGGAKLGLAHVAAPEEGNVSPWGSNRAKQTHWRGGGGVRGGSNLHYLHS